MGFVLEIILIICIACYILIRMAASYQKEKIVRKLAANWGKETDDYRNFGRIAMYADHTCEHKLNDKTIADLNIEEVYSKIDRCNTKIGQQYLYNLLLTPTDNIEILHKRKRLTDLFSTDNELRIKVEYLLVQLGKHVGYAIPNAIFNWKFKPVKNRELIAFLSVLPIILLALGVFVSKLFFLFLFLSFVVNLIFHYKNKDEVEFFITPFSQLKRVRDCAVNLSKLHPDFNEPDVKDACNKLKSLGRYQFLLSSEVSGQNDFSWVAWLLIEYIKITFLIEVSLLNKCLLMANSLRDDMHTIYKFIGLIDTCISIASYRKGLGVYCEPSFTNNQAQLSITEAYHPLIENCVANDLITKGKGILITGSNMSGKTTFIRTIAINTIMAQTIYTVCANSYESTFLHVFSSIGISDSLMQGKSYYLEEIESIYTFIEESKTIGKNNLFVVDELFKGTNTIERIAAAKAVLQYLLSDKNIVIVSTHDMELANLLHKEYDLFHFEESVNLDGFVFDHKMKSGILKTRNAIRLLELFDFPPEIIKAANLHIDETGALKPHL